MEGRKILKEESKRDKLVGLMLSRLKEVPGGEAYLKKLRLEILEDAGCAESFQILRQKDGICIRGTDVRGLAYGIQSFSEMLSEGAAAESAAKCREDKISCPESASEPKDKILCPESAEKCPQDQILHSESPEVRIRGVDKFIMNSDDEEWWMDASYWEAYIEGLAEARFNRLCVATGFDTEYFSPPYAFLVDVEGYEGISAVMRRSRAEYLQALRRIGQICHAYHLEFSFAVWQQQPWERGAEKLVFGLEKQEELCDYCCRGVRKLLMECPEIDVIHFRVNHESGVGTEVSAEDYWLRQIDAVGEVNREGRSVKLELRAKGMTDRMAERALEDGLSLTVSTKYCCEHAGLPHHLTRMRTQELERPDNLNMARRYSYSDLLRKPRSYSFLYRLWCNGSTDLFVWGDPDYVRKFVRSMEVGDADGFEVIPPLTLKGGREFDRHTGWKLFDHPAYQPEGWEDERYWLFYTLYGRLGYCSGCDEIAWESRMQRRLGEKSSLALELIRTASKVIPLVTGFHFPEHPQLWYWPEMSTGAALFAENNYHPDFKKEGDTYQEALPCDEGLFYSAVDYVKAVGHTDGRYTPHQVSGWLSDLEERLEALLEQAEGLEGNWEWKGIVLDAAMLRELAGFHKNKLEAALGLSFWQHQKDGSCLRSAAEKMRMALENWKRLSELGNAYHSNLQFSAGVNCRRRGSWKDYLPEIEADLALLKELARKHGNGEAKAPVHPVTKRAFGITADLPHSHPAGEDLRVTLVCAETLPFFLRYRHTNQLEGEFHRMMMERTEEGYTCILKGDYLTPEWDLMIYFEAADQNGDGMIYPGIEGDGMPYRLIHIR